ncbi:MAG: polysaccharide deacetylase family protein [Parachlamydiales bacterium]|jgi:peptidoglycan/xylan/chitin deacetylase (PgdA/CDA1 family)
MILAFLYHGIGDGKYSNTPLMIQNHLEYLSKNYNIVLPGERTNPFKINICLTFDDGLYGFYYYVFPLLKKLKIKVLLSIPIKYILEDTSLDPKSRLEVSYKDAFKKEVYSSSAPFCTWKELKEMVDSKFVCIASHSFNHIKLTDENLDLELEIAESKKILEKKLNTEVNTFVYPLGKFNEKIHKKVKENYKYAMRIGSAINFSWQNMNSITYRINSDNLLSENENVKLKKYISYLWFFFLNTFRKR